MLGHRTSDAYMRPPGGSQGSGAFQVIRPCVTKPCHTVRGTVVMAGKISPPGQNFLGNSVPPDVFEEIVSAARFLE